MLIDINEVLSEKDKYETTYEKYYNLVKKNFSNRKKFLTVKFPNGKKIKMRLNKFLVNMIFWRPFMEFNRELTEDYIFETNGINSDRINSFMDRIIEDFLDDNNGRELNLCLAEMVSQLGYFSVDFNKKIGNTISLYSLYQLSKNVKEFKDIINTRYEIINTSKIEDDLNKKTKRVLNILGKYENCLQDYVNSQEGLNKNQLTQFLINVGPKPDLMGNVYPRIVNTNFIDGMKSASDYFINSSGGRKSSITNHSKVKTSGYLMRKLSILCMNLDLDTSVKDCGSKNYIYETMNDENTMKRYDKRFYVDEKGKLKLFKYNSKNVEKYQGKTFAFRSPITCACKDGKVCKTCYGDLSKINFDIHIGLLAIEILTSQITQLMFV